MLTPSRHHSSNQLRQLLGYIGKDDKFSGEATVKNSPFIKRFHSQKLIPLAFPHIHNIKDSNTPITSQHLSSFLLGEHKKGLGDTQEFSLLQAVEVFFLKRHADLSDITPQHIGRKVQVDMTGKNGKKDQLGTLQYIINKSMATIKLEKSAQETTQMITRKAKNTSVKWIYCAYRKRC